MVTLQTVQLALHPFGLLHPLPAVPIPFQLSPVLLGFPWVSQLQCLALSISGTWPLRLFGIWCIQCLLSQCAGLDGHYQGIRGQQQVGGSQQWSSGALGVGTLTDNRIYIPDSDDLWLCILWFKHDHLISGHFGQNRTLELVH